MADSFIQIHQDGTGKRVDNSLLTIRGVQVHRQRTEVYAGEILPVSGPATDKELRATPLVISGSVNTGLVQGLTDAQLRASPIGVFTRPLEYEIQHTGAIAGEPSQLYHIIGTRSQGWNSTTALGDACEYLDSSQNGMNTPTIGQTLYIVSSSASDSSAGVGARTVRITYLDATGVQQSTTVTLNGTTPVSLGSGFSFIQWMEVASIGTSEVSVGNLSVTSTNGAATVATTFEYIKGGGNRSLSARYKVPAGKHAHLIDWKVSAINNTMDTRIRATVFSDDGSISTVYHFLDRVWLASGETPTMDMYYRTLPAGAVVKISAIPGGSAAGNKLDVGFTIIVQP